MKDIFFFICDHFILISIWFFSIFVVVTAIGTNLFLKSNVINNVQAINLINKKNAVVIDTRSSRLFQEGHIIRSINIPLNNIFLGKIKEIETYKFHPIIIVLNKTHKKKQCIQALLKYDFRSIYFLKNSMYQWYAENLPIVVGKK